MIEYYQFDHILIWTFERNLLNDRGKKKNIKTRYDQLIIKLTSFENDINFMMIAISAEVIY